MARVGAGAGWNDNYIETITASQTLSYNDSGKVLLVGTDGLTITLPATKACIRFNFIRMWPR